MKELDEKLLNGVELTEGDKWNLIDEAFYQTDPEDCTRWQNSVDSVYKTECGRTFCLSWLQGKTENQPHDVEFADLYECELEEIQVTTYRIKEIPIFKDWNGNVIKDGKYFKTEDGLVQDIEIKDWAESKFETTLFEDGKE